MNVIQGFQTAYSSNSLRISPFINYSLNKFRANWKSQIINNHPVEKVYKKVLYLVRRIDLKPIVNNSSRQSVISD